MAARLGQHSRDLLLGQAFHQLPQLIALSAHLPKGTGLDHPRPRRDAQGALQQSSNTRPQRTWRGANSCPTERPESNRSQRYRSKPKVSGGAGGARTHDLTDYESAALTS